MNSKRLSLIILICISVGVLCITCSQRTKEALEWNERLLTVHQGIDLGRSEEEVERFLSKQWPGDLHNSRIVRTPLRWGAHNWILLIDYKDRRVSAVAMRTDDSYQRLPEGAPRDKLLENFRPSWSPDS